MKYFILVGIGGSNLGAKAVYDALYEPSQEVKLLCADTVSPVMLSRLIAELGDAKKEDVILNYVSKSGKTLESKENFELLKDYAGEIVITTLKDSPIANLGNKTIEHPDVSGRYSVLTEVGLFPLKTCGFDTQALLEGKAAVDMAQARESAEWMFTQLNAGMAVHEMFLFNPELESLGKWHRQLLGESTGKDGKGFYPAVGIGSTDLHSIHQRIMGGPQNVATTFVMAHQEHDATMSAIYEATKKTYREHGLPFQEYVMPQLNEFELGKFFETKMQETIQLASIMGVNPFDQPDVEKYKEEARRILGK